MEFEKEEYKKEFERLLKAKKEQKFFITKSNASFKIKKFIKKSLDSLELTNFINASEQPAKSYWTITISYYSMLYAAKAAILEKGYETDDHYSTQIALGHLLFPSEIEKEDLELLNQSYKIFENDYLDYFCDARKESSKSRYSATKTYDERRVKEIMINAKKFIEKIILILEK